MGTTAKWYNVNFQKGKKGNVFFEGDTMTISIPKASIISGAIYKNGFPVIAFQNTKGKTSVSVKVARKGKSLKGLAMLKVRGYDKQTRGFGVDDAFEIV